MPYKWLDTLIFCAFRIKIKQIANIYVWIIHTEELLMIGLGSNKPIEFSEQSNIRSEANKGQSATQKEIVSNAANANLSQVSNSAAEPLNNGNQQKSTDKVGFEQSVEYNPRTPEELDQMGSMDNASYKTKDVADRLGITEQLVRNYCTYFEPFLDIEKLPSGQRRFKAADIERLGSILQLMRDKGMTVNETIQYLSSGDERAQLHIAPPEEKLDVFFSLISEVIQDAALNSYKMVQQKLIETKDKDSEALGELNKKVEEQKQDIAELKNLLAERDKKIEELLDRKFQELANESTEHNESLKEEIRKKRRFLFFK